MGVKVEDLSFTPKYRVMPDKRKIVAEIAKASEAADNIYLATDPDREGEAISWHLLKAAKIDESKVRRVVFHEITDSAVKEAFDHPRDIDQHLIDAQQTRRVLDRLVGYELSPVLWKKVRRGLSAGRVQSVALRLMVDREREIEAFIADEYWSIEAELFKQSSSGERPFSSEFRGILGSKERTAMANEAEASAITSDLEGATYRVHAVQRRERKSKPAAPFITSTLQQEAYRKLRFTARRTMAVAQQLYEGIDVGSQGAVGLITYMRTDSTNVANSALQEAAQYINEKFGSEYAPKSPRSYTKRVKGAQEAHEAIRPTSIYIEPDSIKAQLSPEQLKLYDLIWRRMLASQMTDAILDGTRIEIDAQSAKSDTHYEFRATGSVLKFPGFRRLYLEGLDNSTGKENEDKVLPPVEKGDALDLLNMAQEQHFTQPPPRYTDATIIRDLEEQGIGRPSTYAPTIATVMDRDYVRKDDGRFVPTKLGIAVTDLLKQHFPKIMDIGFTAQMEEDLDRIAEGEREWNPVLREFYTPFNTTVQEALENAERVPRDQIDEESDEICEVCGLPMVIKSGRFGRFLSCSGFPECKHSAPLMERIGVECPKDGGEIVERKQRKKGGRKFYGCANYPNCDFVVNQKPIPQPCTECGGLLLQSGRENSKCSQCEFKGPVPEMEEAAAA